MRFLFIAEKPDLMREVEKCYKRHQQEICQKVGEMDFVALSGHACAYFEPNDYEEWNDKWDQYDYPLIPRPFRIKPIQSKLNILQNIKSKVPHYEGIVVGTDSDTEGYGIYWLLENYLGIQNKKALRFMEHSLTDKEILESLLTMTDYHKDPVHVRFTQSYIARSMADWLYGMNSTRIATVRSGELLTIGRVKAPTIKLVYDNSMLIENFQKETFYQLTADYGTFQATYVAEDGKAKRFDNEKHSLEIPNDGLVKHRTDNVVRTHAPKLYDLSALQEEAGSSLGLSPKETLEIVQALYEKHKLLSYPRTQCRYVSTERAKQFPELLKKVGVFSDLAPYLNENFDFTKILQDKEVVNDSEVGKESHDALLPTSKTPDLSKLTNKEKQVLKMVHTRLLAQFLPPLTESKTKLEIQHGEHSFRANGKVVLELGWRCLYKNVKQAVLPNVKEGDAVRACSFPMVKQITKPPRRLTQASLVAEMKNFANKIEDPVLRDSLKNSQGIGTSATRAAIISDIVERGYVEDRNGLYISENGKRYIESLQGVDIISPIFAGKMDYEIKKIQRGEASFSEVYQSIIQDLVRTCKQLETLTPKKSSYTCKNCGEVLENRKWSYTCPKCEFQLQKNILGVQITDSIIHDLYDNKMTPMRTFRKKDGFTFKARLKLTETGIGFDFSSGVDCPYCGTDLTINKAGVFCDCGLKVFRKISGKELSDTE